ncbi:MAG: ABC transporter substrate-binding protein, partial [Prolixibacteraceae bacterium]
VPAQEGMSSITYCPHWLPQAQFAGYYAAEEKGFYREAGLNLKIIHPSASVNAAEYLNNGDADIISLFLTTAFSHKKAGLDLVNIGQLSQNSALLFVSKKEKNINKFSDLNGKKIGIWRSGFDEVARTMIKSSNYKVQWVPILSTVNLFLTDYLDAMVVMWYNEYDQIIQAGFNEDELNIYFASDYGYNIPEDGLYCLNKTYVERKTDIEKFVRATFKGWEYVRKNREEAVEMVLKKMNEAHLATNKAHQTWMLNKVLEMMDPGKKNSEVGELTEPDFHKTQNMLFEGGYLDKRFSYEEFVKKVSLK